MTNEKAKGIGRRLMHQFKGDEREAIGTLLYANEKQIPKEPIDAYVFGKTAKCPMCGNEIPAFEKDGDVIYSDYCNCGQRIGWSEEMTNEEAIQKLVNAEYAGQWQWDEELQTAQHMAVDALEKQTQYERYFMVACELMLGGILYGHDLDSIFEELLEEDGYVGCLNFMEYIKNHIEELDH